MFWANYLLLSPWKRLTSLSMRLSLSGRIRRVRGTKRMRTSIICKVVSYSAGHSYMSVGGSCKKRGKRNKTFTKSLFSQ